MPTGIHIRDARRQLFEAAERILLRAGPHALTSRAVTTEAGVAKGVLHRHFADFDAFLADFVLDRAEALRADMAELRRSAGTATVTANLSDALVALFGSVAAAIIPLITFRDDLRTRLRETWPTGIPVLTEAAQEITAYLTAERDLGRLSPTADVETLAPTLIGAAHLLTADRTTEPPGRAAVERMVRTVIAGAET